MIVCKYKFDKSIYENLIPVFNDGYNGYSVSDEIDSENENHVIRTIEYDTLPTIMRFGRTWVEGESTTDARTDSLLEILDMNTSELTSCDSMFRYNTNLTSINCEWDTSNVTYMYSMFSNCYNLTSLDVSNFDTSNVISMAGMFYNCNNLTTLDVSNFNTSKVTDMRAMFDNCVLLTSLDVSNFDTSKVTDMQYMFYNCNKLTSLDVSNFDTSKVFSMSYMFAHCTNLTSLDLSNFNTSEVINMSYMFQNCTKLTSLDVSNFDTSNVTTMSLMFYNCTNLTSLDVSNFDTSKVTEVSYMFSNCTNLTSLDVSNFDTSEVINMQGMFDSCSNLTSLDLSNFNTSEVINMQYIFNGCSNLTSLDVSNFDTSEVINMQGMFSYTYKLTSLDISNWNISNVTDTNYIFSNTPLLADIGMLYCSQDTVNKIIPLIDSGSKTIWVKDTKASDYTATDYVTIKDYKEDNRTLYLNSPLLEGDEIVNKDGKLYHYHKMGSVVLNGSENWQKYGDGGARLSVPKAKIYSDTLTIPNMYCDNLPVVALTPLTKALHGISTGTSPNITIYVQNITNSDSLKQWLSQNPTTVVYELAEPYYELISDDPLIVKSYAEGKLDTSSIISPTSIQSVPYEEELTYLYTSTQYCIQFNSTANCTVDITLGGTKVETKSVNIGLNKIYITTPSTLVDNKLIINAKGSATISEVVVVNSNAEFDYFDGLKSSFEDCLVTDVDNENYGKYEVGVKIVGKNKFNFSNYNEFTHNWIWSPTEAPKGMYMSGWNVTPKYFIKKGTYTLTSYSIELWKNVIIFDDNNIAIAQLGHTNNMSTKFIIPYDCYIRIQFYGLFDSNNELRVQIQLEEETIATSYEPYKETNATIYLNSPLLKGDRIEVVDGKLCHYHKMRSIALDGSENWNHIQSNNSLTYGYIRGNPIEKTGGKIIADKVKPLSPGNTQEGITISNYGGIYFHIDNSKLSTVDANGFKQYLSENPTTVIYELAEPYYEDITPIQSSFVISTVSEGDMEILTDLPIKSNITYLTNIASAVLMEQQLDELDNGAESLTNIVEDEINE